MRPTLSFCALDGDVPLETARHAVTAARSILENENVDFVHAQWCADIQEANMSNQSRGLPPARLLTPSQEASASAWVAATEAARQVGAVGGIHWGVLTNYPELFLHGSRAR